MRDQETDRHPSVNEGDHFSIEIVSLPCSPNRLNHPSVNEGDHKRVRRKPKVQHSLNHPSVNEGDHSLPC